MQGKPAAPVARPRRPARGPAGARRRHRQGRLRGHGREQRRGARARLAAVVRPEHLHEAAQPEAARRAQLGGARQAALQPGDPGRLSHRLDLQARHRHGGARERAHHSGHGPERPGLPHGRRRDVRERRQGRPRRAGAAPGAHGLERRLLLPARPVHEREGHAAPEVGHAGSASGARPGSTSRRRSRGGCRRRGGATAGTSRASPTGPGRSATTSTSRSVRATCSPTRSRWPWPTPRSPTAGACCGRAWACASRTRRGRRSSSSTRRPPGG